MERQPWGGLCLRLLFLLSSQAMAAQATNETNLDLHPLQPADTTSPPATVRTFQENAREVARRIRACPSGPPVASLRYQKVPPFFPGKSIVLMPTKNGSKLSLSITLEGQMAAILALATKQKAPLEESDATQKATKLVAGGLDLDFVTCSAQTGWNAIYGPEPLQ